MPTKVTSWSRNANFGPTVVQVERLAQTSNTTITAGKRDFRAQNPFNRFHQKLLRGSRGTGARDGAAYPINAPDADIDWYGKNSTIADNIAYARFKGKLHYGNASLGVTLAEWQQAREMISKRSVGLLKALDRANRDILRDRALREKIRKRGILTRDILFTWNDDGSHTRLVNRRIDERKRKQMSTEWSLRPGAYVKGVADLQLEYTFGWTPLIKDLKACLTTLFKDGIPPEWVTSRGRSDIQDSWTTTGPYQVTHGHFMQSVHTTYCVNVKISNPNVWLLNRAGLIDVAGVAWDLVPWSFVVNMFVNINTMLSSFTDTVGLELTNQSITRTYRSHLNRGTVNGANTVSPNRDYPGQPPDALYGAVTSETWARTEKIRTLGTPLKPTLTYKVPEMSPELLITTSALLVQKVSKIARLFS